MIEEQSFSYYEPLRKLKQHVDEHYMDEISLTAAAAIACMERKYFSSFFHHKVGICFTDWLTRVRISKAIEFLQAKNDSILQIACEVGFPSVRAFERAFKRYMSLTPLQFKMSVRPESSWHTPKRQRDLPAGSRAA